MVLARRPKSKARASNLIRADGLNADGLNKASLPQNDWTLQVWKILDAGAGRDTLRTLSQASHGHRRQLLAVTLAIALVGLAVLELHSSWIESLVLPRFARQESFRLAPGPSPSLVRPHRGPYDQRLGMSDLPRLISRLEARGFQVTAQARASHMMHILSSLGIEPLYPQKDQAGLVVLDRQEEQLYQAASPRRVYPDFQSIPPLIVQTLLLIENRQMLNSSHPRRNPAIQWGRLGRAAADLMVHEVDRGRPVIGGSTLATQLVKMRHSPGGRTGSVLEKARQVASASLWAYEYGSNTIRAQRQIICAYINSIPLAATRDDGEVIGLADGLKDWYGARLETVNRLLTADESTMPRAQLQARAVAYREALSLLLALHAPTRELVTHPQALRARTDRYLRLLAKEGIISLRLRDLALQARPPLRVPGPSRAPQNFIANKAPDMIRVALLPQLGLENAYALDRLDLTVGTTLDKRTQDSVSSFLEMLSNPQAVQAAGLNGYQLLSPGKTGSVIYSVTLYQRGSNANYLRVQTDNFNQPLDINQGTRLQLGSTAKLRTLINYLQIIEDLHREYANRTPAQLQEVPITTGDNLTKWAIGYLAAATDKRLEPMLEAALARKYSGNPGEAFFTAGGLHSFANFDKSEDSRFFTVAGGFQNSVNLVFIRLMRDIENYYKYRVPGATPDVLSNPDNPARQHYLERFADMEGRTFLRRFYIKYQGQTPDQALQTLVSTEHPTPLRAAVIFRSVRPDAGIAEFSAFLAAHFPKSVLAKEDLGELYTKYGPDQFNLNDRGYLAHVHPLELWLLNYREHHHEPSLEDVFDQSASQRQEVYQWLFKTRYKHAQDKRIETLLEADAFQLIHRAWKQLGYPFGSLTPSYATCIGVSGDTPRALAKLAGILLNDGVRYPTLRITQLHFLQGTPLETVMAPQVQPGVRVLSPVIARLVRQQMIGVVQNGTGRRASGGMRLGDGTVLAIGGKTGTGDNRLQEFSVHGGLIASKAVNRTAAFVFFIGDKFYGTILAFVPGQNASNYKFTSALAVQVLKDLEPRLEPLVAAADGKHGRA
ncbi:MAG TPA: transglycosylase domain-containing protein [Bryobacteraceae bacterium]|nr:transglycosylase domain-containing protein [Bryobacteraceae bacterium]